MTIHPLPTPPPTPPPTCKATMSMHYTHPTYVEGVHTVHTCGLYTMDTTHTHQCNGCTFTWSSVPVDAACIACGLTDKALIEVVEGADDEGSPVVMCTNADDCLTRVHTQQTHGGEGPTREAGPVGTPRPVAISLSTAEADSAGSDSDDVTARLRRRTSDALAQGRTPFVAPDRDLGRGRAIDFPVRRGVRDQDTRAPWLPGFSGRPDHIHYAERPVAEELPIVVPYAEYAEDVPSAFGKPEGRVYGQRRYMSDDRFTPGIQVSEVENHVRRGEDLQGLWQRTVDTIRQQVEVMGDLVEGDVSEPLRAALTATSLELLTVRINIERLRPATEADVAGHLAALRAAVRDVAVKVDGLGALPRGEAVADVSALIAAADDLVTMVADGGESMPDIGPAVERLRQAVLATDVPPRPTVKPASYLVDGLDPHSFRNDGSVPNQNACTWRRPYDGGGSPGPVCGYGANAQVHRRMLRQGKNAYPAALHEPSTRDEPSVDLERMEHAELVVGQARKVLDAAKSEDDDTVTNALKVLAAMVSTFDDHHPRRP